MSTLRLFLTLLILAPAAYAQIDWTPPLPPLEPWDGKSRELIVADTDPWVTPSELTGLTSTPSYDETVAWLRKLVNAAPELEMVSIGKSPQGRDIWMVIASADRAFTPEAIAASGKPTVLAQAGIHSGEIDGKDAGMMLLRDMTVRGTKRDLLEKANLLFIPIFSVDAHERSGPYNRINQRGPVDMGWRTNARNLNLNRDYTKLDTGEMQAMISAIVRWQPDLYLDLHVTDGEDYQYDATFGYNGANAYSPAIAGWLDNFFSPEVISNLEAMGHVPGPLVFGIDRLDFSKGIGGWTATPRFSNGYGDARHLPTVLLENHSLKPYDRRVLGTYLFIESAMRAAGENARALKRAIASDRERDAETIPLTWEAADDQPVIEFKGISSEVMVSPVTGQAYLQWTGKPVTMTIPQMMGTKPGVVVERPRAWWIPVEWSEVIARLRMHGIEMETITEPREIEVEMYRLEDPVFADEPFEGHIRVSATPVIERRTERFPAGSVRIDAGQPLADLAALLLEPESPDSFLQWGFFHSIFSRTEYTESYVMEPLAARMMQDPETRAAYEEKLRTDEDFRSDPMARLNWFYERSPYFDERWKLYPVGREMRN